MPGDCGRWRDLMRRQVLGACSRDQDLQGDSGGSLGFGRRPKISRWRCLRAEQRAPRAAASPAAAAATCVLGGFVLFLNSRGFLVPFCGCFYLSSRSLVCFSFEGGRATVGLMAYGLWTVVLCVAVTQQLLTCGHHHPLPIFFFFFFSFSGLVACASSQGVLGAM